MMTELSLDIPFPEMWKQGEKEDKYFFFKTEMWGKVENSMIVTRLSKLYFLIETELF